MRYFSIMILAFTASLASADVPPPPQSRDVLNVIRVISRSLENNDIGSYEELLSKDVQVWIDEDQVASGRIEWSARLAPKLNGKGVRYKTEKVLAGNESFVMINSYDSRGSRDRSHQECCQYYEIVKFTVSDSKISAIHILTTGSNDVTSSVLSDY